jgi:hypothetical protein
MRTNFQVPGDGAGMQAAVAWQGYFYVADNATGVVHVFNSAGVEQQPIGFDRPGGALELEVRENYLFINAPGSATARVVDDAHGVRTVDKYADDILGGDPPPTPPAPPPPPKPKVPPVTKPGPPRNVRATAGNGEARVTWQPAAANGAAITKYVVAGADRTFSVGANQRSLDVTGLVNGQTYSFEVHAVNKKGDGPAKRSNPVRPTSEVPDPPGAPTATAKADGTVTVNWPAANGQGLKIDKYTVTAISDGTNAPVGTVSGTSLTTRAGDLDYGRQYAFSVVAINEHGAGSKTSGISGTVVPYTKPGRVTNLDAATVATQAGAVKVSWTAPPENGRPITKYVVSAGGRAADVTGGATATTLTGLGNGQSVQVQVVAVNEAGSSDPAVKTAKTVAAPKLTITAGTSTYNSATVTFTVDAGGGTASCLMTTNGKTYTGSCSSLKATGLKSSQTSYVLKVTAKNAAGLASGSRTIKTQNLTGTATCHDNKDSSDPDQRVYCDADRSGRNGNEVFAKPDQSSTQVGWIDPGGGDTVRTVYCKKQGPDVVDSYVYNDHKKSNWWLQIDYKGKNYIPWAWLNLGNGDDLDAVATC